MYLYYTGGVKCLTWLLPGVWLINFHLLGLSWHREHSLPKREQALLFILTANIHTQ